jgi:1-phosphofructokinase family hexose kinase
VILTVTLNPSVDHALFVETFKPHDTNRVLRCERDAGGKGVNLSRVFAELGGKTIATGFLGGSPGTYLKAVLDKQGVVHDFVSISQDTRINFSVEDASGLPPTTLNEKGPEIDAQELQALIDHVQAHAKDARWLCVGGSLPPGVPKDIYLTLSKLGKTAGCRTVLDADGDPLVEGMKAKPDLMKPNEAEAGRFLGREIESDDDVLQAVKDLRERAEIVVISRGERGAVMACSEGIFIGHSPKVETKSTVGSGDSLIAGMLFALESGKTAKEALTLGIACGAATATTGGAEIARKKVIDSLLPKVQVELAAGIKQ